MVRLRVGVFCSFRLNGYFICFFFIDIIINEKFWNVWMDDGWFISLGRMFVDGEKMRIEVVSFWDIN